VKLLRKYGNFSIFQDGGRRHRGFLNFRNFNFRYGQMKTRHRAKIRGDRLNCCGYWDFSIFFKKIWRFFDFTKTVTVCHPVFGPLTKGI